MREGRVWGRVREGQGCGGGTGVWGRDRGVGRDGCRRDRDVREGQGCGGGTGV